MTESDVARRPKSFLAFSCVDFDVLGEDTREDNEGELMSSRFVTVGESIELFEAGGGPRVLAAR